MSQQVVPRLFFTTSIALGYLLMASCVQAQIIPDNTLPVNSIVTPGCTVCTIDGGTVRGANLFHSFSSFGVPTGGEANFNNALQIQNIFTRVTGNSVSNIDGLLRTNGTASLFFLNPNGIIFGAGASLNIGGSFLASTASSLVFADSTIFSTKPATPTTPLLTISVPIGLQYGSNLGSVQVLGSRLEITPGHTLALAGGNVQLNGGQLLAPGGHVELAGVSGGTVGLSVNDSELRLSFPNDAPQADVFLDNGVEVNVRARSVGSGSIVINAQNVNMTGGSKLQAGIEPGSLLSTGAGSIGINATGAINLTDGSFISNALLENAVGNGGSVYIFAGSLFVTNGAFLDTSTSGQGNAGKVDIIAYNTVLFNGVGSNGEPSGAFSRVREGAVGNGGDVSITAGSLSVTNGALLDVSTYGKGTSGNLGITVLDKVLFDGVGSNGESSAALSVVYPDAEGNGGSINIQTGSLFVTNEATVSVSSLGIGDAGNLQVDANSILLDGQAKLIAQSTLGTGGNIQLQAIDLLLLRRDSLISAVSGNPGNNGRDGNINIDTQFLVAAPKENSDIVATGLGRSVGSNIRVNAQGIFGTQFRQQLTPESDLVATGTVQLNTPNVDPAQGLVNLPTTLVDASQQIDLSCSAGGRLANRENSFTITGRGGLPPNPREPLSKDAIQVDWVTLDASANNPTEAVQNRETQRQVSREQDSHTANHMNNQTPEIVEAQGWVINDLGKIALVATALTATPHSSWQKPADCHIVESTK